mmetsp:Transcript_31486/g.77982  ORF Transcript_31486/g.77982 Transcript_31486/m.77982 type:complete len:204 (-) Transcript_31486:176-787(-)
MARSANHDALGELLLRHALLQPMSVCAPGNDVMFGQRQALQTKLTLSLSVPVIRQLVVQPKVRPPRPLEVAVLGEANSVESFTVPVTGHGFVIGEPLHHGTVPFPVLLHDCLALITDLSRLVIVVILASQLCKDAVACQLADADLTQLPVGLVEPLQQQRLHKGCDIINENDTPRLELLNDGLADECNDGLLAGVIVFAENRP